eukprot:GHUV01018516.1.p1 GENE.GHUV01018516.1~~GHUV01018516.1.p1  ORF type:complete len:225 (+),score=88.61 GHUV01018516.1:856-1530(+)
MRQQQKQHWALQKQKQHQHQQQQQQQYLQAGNDDLLPSAPPAFPQPVSSLPSNPMQQYLPPPEALAAAAATMPSQQQQEYPAGILPISSRAYSAAMLSPQHRQQHGLPWTPAAAAAPYSNGITGYQPIPAAAVNATGAPYGYGVDAVPYESVMAQYAVYGGGAYGDSSVPLLTGVNGFMSDMVFANRQVGAACWVGSAVSPGHRQPLLNSKLLTARTVSCYQTC